MLTCVSLCVRACVSSTLEKAEHLLFRGHRGTLKSSANEQNQTQIFGHTHSAFYNWSTIGHGGLGGDVNDGDSSVTCILNTPCTCSDAVVVA